MEYLIEFYLWLGNNWECVTLFLVGTLGWCLAASEVETKNWYIGLSKELMDTIEEVHGNNLKAAERLRKNESVLTETSALLGDCKDEIERLQDLVVWLKASMTTQGNFGKTKEERSAHFDKLVQSHKDIWSKKGDTSKKSLKQPKKNAKVKTKSKPKTKKKETK